MKIKTIILLLGIILCLSSFLNAQPPLTVTATANPSNICEGEQTTIQALPTGGTGTYTYVWESNPPDTTYTLQSPVVFPSVTTVYTVTVNDGSDTASASVTVVVNQIPDAADLISGYSSLCTGTTGHLFSVPPIPNATSYIWSTPYGTTIETCGTNNIFLSVDGIATSGSISVYGVNSCGYGTASPLFPLTVHQSPAVSAASTQNIISYGSSTSLTATVIGGSGSYTYAWTPASALQNANVQNPVTNSLSSSKHFEVEVTDNVTGCLTHSYTQIIVVGGPMACVTYVGAQIICENSSTTLHVLPQGGTGSYSYYWTSNPPGFSSTLQNPVVTPSVTTQYLNTVDDGFNMCNSSIIVNVIQPSAGLGSINGPVDVCEGATSVTYHMTSPPYITDLIWSVTDGAVIVSGQNSDSIVVNYSYNIAEQYILAKALSECGCIISDTLFITPYTTPLADAGTTQTISSGGTVTLNGSAIGGSGNYSYFWMPDTLLQNPNLQNPVSLPLSSPAVFTLLVTDSVTGCTASDSVLVDVIVSTEVFSDSFRVYFYPNPTSGIVTIEMSSKPNENLTLKVFNPIGKLVYKTWLNNDLRQSINLSTLPNGLYFITIEARTLSMTKRVIILK